MQRCVSATAPAHQTTLFSASTGALGARRRGGALGCGVGGLGWCAASIGRGAHGRQTFCPCAWTPEWPTGACTRAPPRIYCLTPPHAPPLRPRSMQVAAGASVGKSVSGDAHVSVARQRLSARTAVNTDSCVPFRCAPVRCAPQMCHSQMCHTHRCVPVRCPKHEYLLCCCSPVLVLAV